MLETEIEITSGTADESLKEEIYRNLQVLYGTTAGEQALDRDFGLSIDLVDHPDPATQAMYISEVIAKTRRYEPRAKVSRVDWAPEGAKAGNLKSKVVIEIV